MSEKKCCAFCGKLDDLQEFRDGYICVECEHEIVKEYNHKYKQWSAKEWIYEKLFILSIICFYIVAVVVIGRTEKYNSSEPVLTFWIISWEISLYAVSFLTACVCETKKLPD